MKHRIVPSVALLRSLRRAIDSHTTPISTHYPLKYTRHHTSPSKHPESPAVEPPISVRKQLKDQAKARKAAARAHPSSASNNATARSKKWELTVGIEIHAELDTAHKLFSTAATSLNDAPNTHVAPFDAALPGAQPQFQPATLLPALRAALALGCEIQKRSSWDRKHYFWWDQPNGYQITQYYEPFAKDGALTLYEHDDIDPDDAPSVTVGIKQIQMEQDTAKTILQPPTTHMLDFNRVSHPLIEIISLPQIHSPKTAAAFVRKIQSILKTLGANTTGMEMGGLRADVNVSVAPRTGSSPRTTFSYGGIANLGQRTEIKNLSSFKAVEDAIALERDRQIAVLEAGGVVEGETRGYTLGSAETRRIRGKEGEVDYRYMPDADLGAVRVADEVLQHLRETMPLLPDETLAMLTGAQYALTIKDAKTLLALDEGDRLDYYLVTVDLLRSADISLDETALGPTSRADVAALQSKAGKTAANWLLHELGSRLSTLQRPWDPAWSSDPNTSAIPPPSVLADILTPLSLARITLPVAKQLLHDAVEHHANSPNSVFDVHRTIRENSLALQPLSEEEYTSLANTALALNTGMAEKIRTGGERERGKIMWFVGQMVKQDDAGRVQPERARAAVEKALFPNL